MTAESSRIILGTRGSELARAQARLVKQAIQAVRPEVKIETKTIPTEGDKVKVVDLRAGRKGLFTAEIERALLAGIVDVAVHSAKDLPSETNPGAEIAAALPRAPMDDVLVSRDRGDLAAREEGATIATGSVRRKHQLSWQRPDLNIVDLRGNCKFAPMIKEQKRSLVLSTIARRCFVCARSENFCACCTATAIRRSVFWQRSKEAI